MPRRRTIGWAALTAATLVLTGASPASAGANPYTPADACGASYKTVSGGTYSLYGAKVYVMYDAKSGRNCVATMKTTNIGVSSGVGAGLKLTKDPSWTDNVDWEYGNFKYYAVSPTKYYAKGSCIDIYGASGDSAISQYGVFCGLAEL